MVLVGFGKAPQEHLEALVKGSAEGKGSVACMGLPALYDVIAARGGAPGNMLHRTVVEDEEVVPLLR